MVDQIPKHLRAFFVGRCFILDGYAIADEYRMTNSAGGLTVLGSILRTYDPAKLSGGF